MTPPVDPTTFLEERVNQVTRRRNLSPRSSVFSQRVERQMANNNMDVEAARQAVRDRRAARQDRIQKLQEEFGYSTPQAKKVLRYTTRNAAPVEADAAPVEPNYNRSRRIIDTSRRKGLTRAEAATILSSRAEARANQAAAAQ
jgi:hypothetical protein